MAVKLKILVLVLALSGVVSGRAAAMEPKISPEGAACRLVFKNAGASKRSQREPICIRNISADSCEELASAQLDVADALAGNFSVQSAPNCAVNDCVLDVVDPSDTAHCQGISLTPTRLKVDKTTTSGPVSASF